MNATDKPVENATPPRRRWPLIVLVVGLLFLGGQIYLQRDYWGLVLHQGTLFPNMQRANYMGRREAESIRPPQELPIPGSPASLAGTIPPVSAPPQSFEGAHVEPETGEAKTKP